MWSRAEYTHLFIYILQITWPIFFGDSPSVASQSTGTSGFIENARWFRIILHDFNIWIISPQVINSLLSSGLWIRRRENLIVAHLVITFLHLRNTEVQDFIQNSLKIHLVFLQAFRLRLCISPMCAIYPALLNPFDHPYNIRRMLLIMT
jgi:hypothetical protein